MNTMLRNSNAPTQSALAPSSLTTTGRPQGSGGGIHKGVWIGGGLMALTIVALATALLMKGNGSGSETVAPLAATPAATTTVPATPAPDAAAVPPAATVAQTQAPAPTTAPVHTASTHHTATHSTGSGSGYHPSNTSVADAGSTYGGSGATNTTPSYSAPPAPPAVCTTCGTIESFDAVKVQGQTNGVGAVGGGAVGAVVGSQIAGRHNHTLGGVIGAIGGGLLGNEIEKSQRTTTVYDVHVRMDDGSMRTIRQSAAPVVGSKVTVNGSTLSGRSSSNGGSYGNGGSNFQPAPSGNGSGSFSPSGN